jgi:nucleoside-diphosphate-sugar epimerase
MATIGMGAACTVRDSGRHPERQERRRLMKMLFTGATGVIGRAAVPLLTARGHEVTAVSRSETDRGWLLEVGARPELVDLFDPDAVLHATAGMDAVIHYATAIPPQATMAERER